METIAMSTAESENNKKEELRIHEWRVEQLQRVGVPRTLAFAFAGLVDWHEIAKLVERGCPPKLALEIVR
jgi:hypothetical protein